jgi:flagellar biosynthesis/type III secretory pathway M-ring protein FliF/YscJ
LRFSRFSALKRLKRKRTENQNAKDTMENFKNFFTHNYAKLKDLYMSMTLGNRIVATLLAATLVISFGYLIVGSIPKSELSSQTVRLYDGYPFSTSEKGSADAAFAREGLSDHIWVGDQLQVPKSKKNKYTVVIADNDVFEKRGFARDSAVQGLTAWLNARLTNEKVNRAKESDIADTIKLIPGITYAEIYTNKRPDWNRNVWARTQVWSLAVTVRGVDNTPLSQDTIGTIARIVGPAFGILDHKEIGIVDLKNSKSYDGSGEEVGTAMGAYRRHQANYEKEWHDKIKALLPDIAGMTIKASVDLTEYRSEQYFDVMHRKPTPLVEHEMDLHIKKEGRDRFGRPGQIAQFGSPLIDPTPDISYKDLYEEKKREMERTMALPGRETKTEALPFIPQRVYISIQVPREYIVQLWRERNKLYGNTDVQMSEEVLLAEEEKLRQEIKEIVAGQIGNLKNPKDEPMDLVKVGYFNMMLPEPVELSAWEQFVLFMQQHWRELGLMSLVFSGLVVMWSISKPPKPDNIVLYEGDEIPMEAIDARLEEKRLREEEARRLAELAALEEAQEAFENSLGELGSLRTLRDEVAELIAKNPEAAAAVIRQWIGNAVLVEAKA